MIFLVPGEIQKGLPETPGNPHWHALQPITENYYRVLLYIYTHLAGVCKHISLGQ